MRNPSKSANCKTLFLANISGYTVSGAPLASMMCVENPESFREIICVAGERPLNCMTDPIFETMSNPDKFPYGGGIFRSERPRKLTYIQSKTVRC